MQVLYCSFKFIFAHQIWGGGLLVSPVGGLLVSSDGGLLVSSDGGLLVSPDGGLLVSPDLNMSSKDVPHHFTNDLCSNNNNNNNNNNKLITTHKLRELLM